MIDYFKKHKLVTFIMVIYTLAIVVAYLLYKLFLSSSGAPVYGSRLDGIEKVAITEAQIKKLSDDITKEPYVLRLTKPYLKGKTFKVVVDVDFNAKVADTKKISDKVLAELTDEQEKFFDIQILINKYYDCNLSVSGKADEDGNYVEPITVKFASDLSKNQFTLNYGISNVNKKDYNKKQEFKIEKDGEYIIYGFTQDKSAEQSCSIKLIKQTAKPDQKTRTLYSNSLANPEFPIIGYKSVKSKVFVWQ